jgi:hypothetical protein
MKKEEQGAEVVWIRLMICSILEAGERRLVALRRFGLHLAGLGVCIVRSRLLCFLFGSGRLSLMWSITVPSFNSDIEECRQA